MHQGSIKQWLLLSVAATTVAPFSAIEARAQEGGVDTIVVTSTKREQSAQDVPITINVASGDQLHELGVTNATDISTLFPNLSLNVASDINQGFTIRGIGNDNFFSNADSAVGLYFDEVTLATPFSGSLSLWDLERVEVLRGPQNTLFGRNTTGGAVNYISVKPEVGAGTTGYVRGTYGRFNKQVVEGAVGFDLGDRAAARISALYDHRDGPFTNLADNGSELGAHDKYGFRGQLLFEPTDNTSVLLNGHWADNDIEGGWAKANGMVDPNNLNALCSEDFTNFETTNNCVAIIGINDNPATTPLLAEPFNPSTSEWDQVYSIGPNLALVENFGGFLRIDHEFANFTFTSITTYDETTAQFTEDNGGVPFITLWPHQDAEYQDISQELRLTSTTDSALQWLAGFYYFNQQSEQATNVTPAAARAVTPDRIFQIMPGTFLDQEDELWSVYAQVNYAVNDIITLNGGLRYSDNEKTGDIYAAAPPFGSPPDGRTIEPIYYGADVQNYALESQATIPLEEWGYNFSVDVQLSDEVLAYGSVSRGFKAGAFDVRPNVPTRDNPIEAEFLDAYEVGLKSTFLDNRVQINSAMFVYNFEGKQAFVVQDGNNTGVNVPKAEVLGADLDFTTAPWDGWLFRGGVGLLHSEITDNTGVEDVVSSGVPLSRSPEFTANLLAQKSVQLETGELLLTLDGRHVGESWDQINGQNRPDQFMPAENYLNGRVSYIFGPEAQYEISLFGQNLTGEKVCREVAALDSPAIIADVDRALESYVATTASCPPNVGRPEWGVTLEVQF